MFKSRLVVQGWSQVPGVGYRDTFTPVCSLQSSRMVLAIVAELDYEFYMMNIQAAFLNADMKEEVFVQMPPPGTSAATRLELVPLVMKPKKRLYELRQSPKNWFGTMDQCLGDIGFRPPTCDPCVYIYEDEVGFIILTLYVDDLVLLGAKKLPLNKPKKQLTKRFEITPRTPGVGPELSLNHRK